MTKTQSGDAKHRWDTPLKASIGIASVVFLSPLGWTIRVIDPEAWRIDTIHDLLPRFACIVVLAALVWASVRWIGAIDTVERSTAWWSISAKAKKPTWDDVRRMTLGECLDDPVRYQATSRPGTAATAAKMTLGWLLAGSLVLPAAALILKWPARPIMLIHDAESQDTPAASKRIVNLPAAIAPAATEGTSSCPSTSASMKVTNPKSPACRPIEHSAAKSAPPEPAEVNLNLNGNLTAFLALVAAAVSIVFTHQQLQAKVKADSRQAWISKLRANIARFIALADTVHDKPHNRSKKTTQELTTRRLEMELMLNPSERDHRLLMYLSLKIAFFDDTAGFQKVDDVKNLEAAIKASDGYVDGDWQPLLNPLPTDPADETELRQRYSDLIGYTMRLAHVVLKREWEQVKATR